MSYLTFRFCEATGLCLVERNFGGVVPTELVGVFYTIADAEKNYPALYLDNYL